MAKKIDPTKLKVGDIDPFGYEIIEKTSDKITYRAAGIGTASQPLKQYEDYFGVLEANEEKNKKMKKDIDKHIKENAKDGKLNGVKVDELRKSEFEKVDMILPTIESARRFVESNKTG